jgi:hypothetical protein
MSAHPNTLPELDQRLSRERSAVVETVDRLRRRVRSDIYEMSPRRQLKRHAGVSLALAGFVGLVSGRIAGRFLRFLLF